jgi:hypothetical protein
VVTTSTTTWFSSSLTLRCFRNFGYQDIYHFGIYIPCRVPLPTLVVSLFRVTSGKICFDFSVIASFLPGLRYRPLITVRFFITYVISDLWLTSPTVKFRLLPGLLSDQPLLLTPSGGLSATLPFTFVSGSRFLFLTYRLGR